MNISYADMDVLRRLAERYSEIANADVQQQRIDRYTKTNIMADDHWLLVGISLFVARLHPGAHLLFSTTPCRGIRAQGNICAI